MVNSDLKENYNYKSYKHCNERKNYSVMGKYLVLT